MVINLIHKKSLILVIFFTVTVVFYIIIYSGLKKDTYQFDIKKFRMATKDIIYYVENNFNVLDNSLINKYLSVSNCKITITNVNGDILYTNYLKKSKKIYLKSELVFAVESKKVGSCQICSSDD